MQKYNVVEECEVLGEVRAAGSEVELEEADAAPLVEAGKLTLVESAA